MMVSRIPVLCALALGAAGLPAGGAAAQNSAEVDPIVIKGAKFFYKTNGTEL